MVIRQETPNDYNEIYDLVKEAFATADHADGNEQDLVTELRKGSAFLPELSLVAEIDGKLAGHIMFTKASVGNDPVLVLAPLSVKPEYQNKGVNGLLFSDLIRTYNAKGYKWAESNPELEVNEAVQRQWGYFEHIQHKRRRAYKKQIDNQ